MIDLGYLAVEIEEETEVAGTSTETEVMVEEMEASPVNQVIGFAISYGIEYHRYPKYLQSAS